MFDGVFMGNLKEAFSHARHENNIALALPDILASDFFAVGIYDVSGEEGFDLALTRSPDRSEFCITVSESRRLVTFPEWRIIELNGRELLKKTPKNSGILIAYEAGGDYLSRDQVDYLLSFLEP